MPSLRSGFIAATALATAMLASGAGANIIIESGDTPGSLTNVHFDEAQSGTTITGFTQPNKGGFGVEFTSSSTLTTTGIGQADITGTFTFIDAAPLDPSTAFQTFQFAFKLDADGDATINAVDQFGNLFTETFTDLSAEANHRFTLTAEDDQVIAGIDVTTTSNMTNFRQVRILEADMPVEVPEPAPLALLGTGLIALGLMRRRAKA